MSIEGGQEFTSPSITEALARTSERLQRLLQAARRLSATLDPHEVYDSLVALLHDVITFDGLVVSSYDSQSGEIRCQYAWVEGDLLDPAGFPTLNIGSDDEGMQSRVIRSGLPHLFGDVERRVRASGTFYEIAPDGETETIPKVAPADEDYRATRSAMMAPIVLDGNVLGVVQVMSMREGAYSQDDLELLEGMVIQMGAAARNAALYVTAQREVEERTKAQAAIEELNVRLQRAMAETHHRVKNNLQVLTALVDIEMGEDRQVFPRSSLERLNSQIRSLASLHDLLTQGAKAEGTASTVPVLAVLTKLIGLMEGVGLRRSVQLEAADLELPVRQCTPFTLLVNELVSNSVKHGRGDIVIRVTCSQSDAAERGRRSERRITLEVEDDGPGFPPDFSSQDAANTGLELIESLGRWDLGGSVVFENRPDGGARVSVQFPYAHE